MIQPISRSGAVPPSSPEDARLNQVKSRLSSHMKEFSQLLESLLQSHTLSDNPDFHKQLVEATKNLASSSKEAQNLR